MGTIIWGWSGSNPKCLMNYLQHEDADGTQLWGDHKNKSKHSLSRKYRLCESFFTLFICELCSAKQDKQKHNESSMNKWYNECFIGPAGTELVNNNSTVSNCCSTTSIFIHCRNSQTLFLSYFLKHSNPVPLIVNLPDFHSRVNPISILPLLIIQTRGLQTY